MVQMQPLFKRFDSIDRDYICTDKHIHSAWTDGDGSVWQIAKKAKESGLVQIAIVDHIRTDSTYFVQYCEEIEEVNRRIDIDILVGFEAKIKNFQGDIDVSNNVIEKAQIKIASVHRFPIGRKLYQPKEFKKKICQEVELELSIATIKSKRCNVIGHPGGMSLITYNEFPLDFFEEIIIGCKNNNVAFELNTFYHHLVLRDLKTLLRKHNVLVSLGSDAHKIRNIGSSIKTLKKVIINE